jgi:hypothetical protein
MHPVRDSEHFLRDSYSRDLLPGPTPSGPRPRKELYGNTMLLRITVSRRVVSHPRADPCRPHAISRRPEAGRLKHCIAGLRCFATLQRRI